MASLGTLMLLVLLRGPGLASRALSNAGMLVLRDGLMVQTDFPGAYPAYGALGETPGISGAVQTLRRAVAMDASNLSARWALGRAALAVGDAETAAGALGSLASRASHNPLLYHDVLVVLSRSGRPEEVIALYGLVPAPQHSQVVTDAVALAYLDLAMGGQGDGGTGDRREARQWLEQALMLRPGDLYANYRLWQQAWKAGEIETAAAYGEALTYFPLEAIHPADERVLNYVAAAMPALLEDGLWNREKTLNVVSFLVWRHTEAAGVEGLLERLIERYPSNPDWPLYMAELYHRRGDLDRAEAMYRRVLELDPTVVPTYLRLGLVAEARLQIPNPKSQEWLEEAAGWYGRYYHMAPDDLMGLRKLAKVCTALEEAGVSDPSCQEATEWAMGGQGDKETRGQGESGDLCSPGAVLQEALAARTDGRRVVAELLGVPVEDTELGSNLVENGGFEEWREGAPVQWRWLNMANREPWSDGLFAGGHDPLDAYEQESAVRVEGFWLQHDGEEPARAGYGYRESQVNLEPGRLYVLTFAYRTQLPGGAAGVWLSQDPVVVFGGEQFLPATGGAWREYVILGRNESPVVAPIWPLLRNWGEGAVWFDALQVREVGLSREVAWPGQGARFALR